jgi:hypothetical protein
MYYLSAMLDWNEQSRTSTDQGLVLNSWQRSGDRFAPLPVGTYGGHSATSSLVEDLCQNSFIFRPGKIAWIKLRR